MIIENWRRRKKKKRSELNKTEDENDIKITPNTSKAELIYRILKKTNNASKYFKCLKRNEYLKIFKTKILIEIVKIKMILKDT